ncbi:MAG: hypothetical protein AAF363_16965 [Bacteroidota bacterium]
MYILLITLLSFFFKLEKESDYLDYHRKVIEIEKLIVENEYQDALNGYKSLFDTYDFVFVRDYKVAAQLAFKLKLEATAMSFVKMGIRKGWILEDIKKNKFLKSALNGIYLKELKSEYYDLRQTLFRNIDLSLKETVHEMFKKDQKKAFGALLRIGDKAQTRYSENKFGPHSIDQLKELDKIISENGYPGERLIGNDIWASTILSHHNSISPDFSRNDTLYPVLKPKLLGALEKGEISPFEFAVIEDWRIAVLDRLTGYGFLGPDLTKERLNIVNQNRSRIGMRSIELRNQLVEIEEKTGMDFYLLGGPWQKGLIKID